MALKSDYVLHSLLSANYFPNQKSKPSELPKVFTTKSLTPKVACELSSLPDRKISGYLGYDAIEFQITRFDGRTRRLAIPHPRAHACLSLCIHEHWGEIKYIEFNRNSKIRPKQHPDGRLIVMSYGEWKRKVRSQLKRSLLHKFVVKADVAQCFPSIYSHAIAWATVGMKLAKQSVGNKHRKEWFNELDHCVMMQKRNETSGVLVGPGTSNIIVELILARVDEELRGRGFTFERYIDDYIAYVDSIEQSNAFLDALGKELIRYKLSLNDAKSGLKGLPGALFDRVIVDLANLLPQDCPVGLYEAISYLNFAVAVANEYPSVSAIKYAMKSLLRKGIAKDAIADVLLHSLMLAYHQPGLLPLLEMLPRRNLLNGITAYEAELNRMIQDYAQAGRSDGVVWAMYFLKEADIIVSDDSAQEILRSQDCLSLVLLYHFGDRKQQQSVVEFAKSVAKQDPYTLDQYWLLLFEIYRTGQMQNPYSQFGKDQAFEVMRKKGVRFISCDP